MKEKATKLMGFKRSVFVLLLFVLASLQAFAQGKSVSGVITDEKGEAAISATVKVKGTSLATLTDFNGAYAFKDLPATASSIEVSYFGYETQELDISGEKVNFKLKVAAATELQEVTITTVYGQKTSLSATSAKLSGNSLKERPVTNVAEALTGQIAGLSVKTAEGSPDATVQLNVRGVSSITQSSEPLYIVDGMPVSSISDIPANVIQSVDVLKDASATAIYGARGANGVILITTKDAVIGDKDGCDKITVDYAGSYGMKWKANTLPVLSAKEYALWQYERALISGNGVKADSNAEYKNTYKKYFGYDGVQNIYEFIGKYDGKNVDWQEEVFGEQGSVLNNSLTISGGSKVLNYNLNYSRLDENAILKNSGFTKDFLQFKLNAKPTKQVKLGATTRYSKTEITGSVANEGGDEKSKSEGLFKRTYYFSPIHPNDYATTDLTGEETDAAEQSALINPLTYINDNYKRTTKKTISYNGYLSWEFYKDLVFRTEGSFDQKSNSSYRYYGPSSFTSRDLGAGQPLITTEDLKETKYRNTNTLLYDRKFKKNHNLSALLGQEMIVTTYDNSYTEVRNLPSTLNSDNAYSLSGAGSPVNAYFTTPADDRLLSFFGRVNYDFKRRYIFSATMRADGSSKFAVGNQWGYFPAFSAAWRASDEKFMKSTKSWLTDLKLRLSYGTSGNNNIESSLFTEYYVPSVDKNSIRSYRLKNQDLITNPELVWETTVTRDFGLDFGFLKDRINGTLDLYWNSVSDLLVEMKYESIGKGKMENIGSTSNKGVELTLNGQIIKTKKFNLNAGFNVAYNKNTIDDLVGMDATTASSGVMKSGYDFYAAVGESLGNVYGYVYDGRYEATDFEWNGTSQKWAVSSKYTKGSDGVYRDANGSVYVIPLTGTTPAGQLTDATVPGNLKLKDLNGDGKITEADKTVIGNTVPKITGGFNLSASYSNFDLSANFNYVLGVDVYNADRMELEQAQSGKFRNLSSTMASGSRWNYFDTDGNYVTDVDKLMGMNASTTEELPLITSTYILHSKYIEDGSFLRLTSVTLGYNFSPKLIKKLYLSKARIFVSGGNLFCLTNYSGMDPEVNTRRDTPMTPGVDWSAYPKAMTLTAGVNLTF